MVRARPTHSTAHEPLRSPRGLIVGLSIVVLTVAVLQTAVVPVLGVIADQLDVSPRRRQLGGHREPARRRRRDSADRSTRRSAQQEARAARGARRRAGRLGARRDHVVARPADRRRASCRRPRIALYPIGVAILREELARGPHGVGDVGAVRDAGLRRRHRSGRGRPADERRRRISPRLLADDGVHASSSSPSWSFVVPARPRSTSGTIDWLGAAGLAAGLSALLLAITQGNSWGWTSPRDAGLRRVRRARPGRLVDVGATGEHSRWSRPRC